MPIDNNIEIGETNKFGWTRVECRMSAAPANMNGWIHECYYCGQKDAVYLNMAQPNQPNQFDKSSHDNEWQCIRYLRDSIDKITSSNK